MLSLFVQIATAKKGNYQFSNMFYFETFFSPLTGEMFLILAVKIKSIVFG